MEILIYGIINSIALTLMSLGFALVYGISRVPNFAHGALYVISGFVTWSLLRTLGLPYFISILLALAVTGGIGAAIYQFVLIRVRGMAQDERAALMLGIDSDLMALSAMVLGAMLAGLAGIMLLPLGNIVVEAGYNVLILSIAVCIVGGLGSWAGAVLAAFLIGFVQILTVVYLGAHFQMVVALLAIILTLILKPSGLFGMQKELEERV